MRNILALCILLAALPCEADPAATTGGVSGTVVAVKGGKPVKAEYVYVYLKPSRPRRGKPPGAGLQPFHIHQKDRQFTPHVLVVPTGSVVTFPNDDRETHNVFSPNGPPKQFDLKRYNTDPVGPPHTFDDVGEIELFCDIHQEMWAKVKVVDTPYIEEVVDGKYTLSNVEPGTYQVVAWAPSSTEVVSQPITVTAGQTVTSKELHLQVAPIHTTHVRKDGKPYCPDGYSNC